MEVLGAGEVLPDQFGTDDDVVSPYQTAVGLAREQRSCENEKCDRKDYTGQEGEREDAQEGRPKLLPQGYDERRWR